MFCRCGVLKHLHIFAQLLQLRVGLFAFVLYLCQQAFLLRYLVGDFCAFFLQVIMNQVKFQIVFLLSGMNQTGEEKFSQKWVWMKELLSAGMLLHISP